MDKNSYFASLLWCPELVDNIERLLNIQEMRDDYYNNSKYYCIEYLIPMKAMAEVMGVSYESAFVFPEGDSIKVGTEGSR